MCIANIPCGVSNVHPPKLLRSTLFCIDYSATSGHIQIMIPLVDAPERQEVCSDARSLGLSPLSCSGKMLDSGSAVVLLSVP